MRTVIKFGAAAFVSGLILGGLIIGVWWSASDALPACQTEDSTHCYWDASEQGNGTGTDFVTP